MSHPRDPQITSNNSYKHVYFEYLPYQNFFEMSRDDHPRHSSKHVHFKYLAYLTSKCLEILSRTPNYLKLVQKIWNRKYLHNCKLYTIEVVLMGPKSGQDALKHILGLAKHSVTIWDKGEKITGRRKRSHVPANSGSTIPWCTRLWHPLKCFCYAECVMHHIMTFLAMCLLCRLCDSEEVFISGFHWINRKAVSSYQQFHWWVKTPNSTISPPCKLLLDLSLPGKAYQILFPWTHSKSMWEIEVRILCKHDHMIETASNPNPSASGKAFGGNWTAM